MIEGRLYYDENADRFVVTGNKGKKYFLHCGDPLEVLIEGSWLPTTVEGAWGKEGINAWYLVGISQCHGLTLQGLRARV